MKKGWFKKAKRLFVKRRVYEWKFQSERGSQPDFTLSCIVNDYPSCSGWFFFDQDNQILAHLRSLSFVKGFWKARELSKTHSDDYKFLYTKVIKI